MQTYSFSSKQMILQVNNNFENFRVKKAFTSGLKDITKIKQRI